MKKFLIVFLCSLFSITTYSQPSCAKLPTLLKKACQRLKQVWNEGDNEAYLTLYAWHNRYTYTRANRLNKSYNEQAWGGGFGKGLYDEKGDWHGLYAFAFLDSHKNIQPVTGYAFLKTAHLNDHTRVGIGYSLLLTMRPDIFNGYPFPGAAPWVGFSYRQATIAAVYIPGKTNIGNVLFVYAKWTFDKL